MANQDALFDGQLDPGLDIPELWRAGRPYGQLSPRRDMRRAGNLLIREHPRERFPNIKAQAELQDMLDTAKRHFEQLRVLGMHIVSHETVINPAPWPEDDFEWDEEDTVAFSASAYLTHLQPLRSRSFKPLCTVPKSKVNDFIIEPLRRYMDWGIPAGETLMLNDIFTPDQYGWQESSGILALHDHGPQMSPIDSVLKAAEEDITDGDFQSIGH